MTGRVTLSNKMIRPGLPDWAVWGDAGHRRNLICSIYLSEPELEEHNKRLIAKYAAMSASEQRADLFHCADADTLIVACTTPAQMAKGAVQQLRQKGVKVGLFRPVTLWPFPIQHLLPLLKRVERIVVVEASDGQLEDELRLALSNAGIFKPPLIENIRHYGGVLPGQTEIVNRILATQEVAS